MNRLSPIRVFPSELGDGPGNMARDEAMLDELVERPEFALFRIYQWSAPTLSLGYFQTIHDVKSQARWLGLDVVRRPTGGGALLHDQELTYALVLPRTHPFANRNFDLYESVHNAIAEVLNGAGGKLDVQTHARVSQVEQIPSAPSKDKPFLCFLDRVPQDLTVHGHKVMGSAQRRRSGAILQHGALLLRRSSRTPELPGWNDLVPVEAQSAALLAHLEIEVPRLLGFSVEREDWPARILKHSERLENEVYRSQGWTDRR